MALGPDTRVPVTVITGHLGAGKTTLVNHLLDAAQGRRFAVIVNEFGDIGVDGDLIRSGDEELIELSSGCVCCVVRGDLIRTLRGLLKRDSALDGILIETTGVANPGPVIQTFTADQILAGLARLDAVVTVVDAAHIALRLADSEDAADQVVMASLLVLNKASLANDPDATEASLRALNPHAPIRRTDRARVDVADVLDTRGFSLERIAADLTHHEPERDHHHDHVAANGIQSLSLTEEIPLDAGALEAWLERVLMLYGAEILRIKGVLSVAGEPRRVVVQAVHMMHEGDYGPAWGDAPRRSKIVFIGRNLDRDALRSGFAACRTTATA